MIDKTSMTNKSNMDERNLVDRTIRNRTTKKVIAIDQSEVCLEADAIKQVDQQVLECIDVSGWAPFHYDRKRDDLAEPWRYAVLFHEECRKLSQEFFEIFSDIKPSNKLPKMLMACGALVLVNWLPETEIQTDKINQVNEEHLAAASAAAQNLILALEARGLGTYWSSGGVLGSTKFYERIGMDQDAKLIAAVFVNYPGLYPNESVEIIAGKNREKRSDWSKWTKVIG